MPLSPIIFDKLFNPPSGFVMMSGIQQCRLASVTSKLDACQKAEGLGIIQSLQKETGHGPLLLEAG